MSSDKSGLKAMAKGILFVTRISERQLEPPLTAQEG